MKRKLDPNKVYAFIGRVVVYGILHITMSAMLVYSFMQNTIY